MVIVEVGRVLLEELQGGVDDVLVAGGNVVEVMGVDEVRVAVEPGPVDVVGVDEELAAVARSPM